MLNKTTLEKKISKQDESPGQRKEELKNMPQTNIHKGCDNLGANLNVFHTLEFSSRDIKASYFPFYSLLHLSPFNHKAFLCRLPL